MRTLRMTGALLSLVLLAAAGPVHAERVCIVDRDHGRVCEDIDDPATGPDEDTAEAARGR